MREYTVLYERGETNWGAVVPDLPGCVSIGDTFEDVQRNVREAIALYIDTLHDKGLPIPEPRHESERVAVAA